jgi:hypothetical protein
MQNVILILGDVRVGNNVLKLTDSRWTQIVHNYYYMYCIYTAYIQGRKCNFFSGGGVRTKDRFFSPGTDLTTSRLVQTTYYYDLILNK